MTKKIKKSDCWFAVCMLVGLVLHFLFIFSMQPLQDESFYPSIALRVINGDSLMQDEWHMTQFSSIFLYLPIRIFLALAGSTDGIILFLRIFYLVIHTALTAGIYIFFRKYGGWAVASAIMFYIQTPYRMLAVSYNSMYVIFLILFVLCILLIYKKQATYLYVLAGACFGAGCVANPFLCIVYFAYIVFCVVWSKKRSTVGEDFSKKNAKKKSGYSVFMAEEYDCFFSKKAILFLSCGISVVAVISIIYYFSIGGTLSVFFENLPNLFSSSEYTVFSSFLEKIKRTFEALNSVSLNMTFLLPTLLIALIIDKNRKNNIHRVLYLIFSLALVILFVFGIYNAVPDDSDALAFSMPFSVIGFVSYILTENKNKKLFYCMWCPCVLAALIQFVASNTILTSIGMVLAVNNIAGVFFVRDLFKEMRIDLKEKEDEADKKKEKMFLKVGCSAVCIGIFVQLVFQCYIYQYGRIPQADYEQATVGPYAYFYMNEYEYDNYTNSIKDLDEIKARSKESDPILIISYFNWMYLYIDRPFANFTTWQQTFKYDVLRSYYNQNPDKIPRYIYIGFADSSYNDNYDKAQAQAKIMCRIFKCVQEELSNGILLTVTE